MYLLMLVLDDTSHLTSTLEAWQRAGVHGATALESTGLQRLMDGRAGDEKAAAGHKTIFAVVNDLEMAELAMRHTQGVIGDLNAPNTGIAFLVPVLAAWGLP
ncbi:MAG TPA: hypothetical protein PK829_06810 [Promineifilum sp.]|nr:hypothetical protein [Promineifilum sp.]HQF70990.1 hypothetical protein [Promineifilum sp.]